MDKITSANLFTLPSHQIDNEANSLTNSNFSDILSQKSTYIIEIQQNTNTEKSDENDLPMEEIEVSLEEIIQYLIEDNRQLSEQEAKISGNPVESSIQQVLQELQVAIKDLNLSSSAIEINFDGEFPVDFQLKIKSLMTKIIKNDLDSNQSNQIISQNDQNISKETSPQITLSNLPKINSFKNVDESLTKVSFKNQPAVQSKPNLKQKVATVDQDNNDTFVGLQLSKSTKAKEVIEKVTNTSPTISAHKNLTEKQSIIPSTNNINSKEGIQEVSLKFNDITITFQKNTLNVTAAQDLKSSTLHNISDEQNDHNSKPSKGTQEVSLKLKDLAITSQDKETLTTAIKKINKGHDKTLLPTKPTLKINLQYNTVTRSENTGTKNSFVDLENNLATNFIKSDQTSEKPTTEIPKSKLQEINLLDSNLLSSKHKSAANHHLSEIKPESSLTKEVINKSVSKIIHQSVEISKTSMMRNPQNTPEIDLTKDNNIVLTKLSLKQDDQLVQLKKDIDLSKPIVQANQISAKPSVDELKKEYVKKITQANKESVINFSESEAISKNDSSKSPKILPSAFQSKEAYNGRAIIKKLKPNSNLSANVLADKNSLTNDKAEITNIDSIAKTSLVEGRNESIDFKQTSIEIKSTSTLLDRVEQFELVNKLTQKMNIKQLQNHGIIKIRIDPPELGELVIKMTLKGKDVHISIITQNSIASEILENNKQLLMNSFKEHGLEFKEFDISSQGKQNQNNSEQTSQDPNKSKNEQHNHKNESFRQEVPAEENIVQQVKTLNHTHSNRISFIA